MVRICGGTPRPDAGSPGEFRQQGKYPGTARSVRTCRGSCVRAHGALATCVRIHTASGPSVGSGVCADKRRPVANLLCQRASAAFGSFRFSACVWKDFIFLMREENPVDPRYYLSIEGSLMYAALGTRPDIAFCVGALSRFHSAPLQMHLTATKRALRYPKHTAYYGVHFRASHPDRIPTVLGFTDSDRARNLRTPTSIGAFFTFVPKILHPSTGSPRDSVWLPSRLWRPSIVPVRMPPGRPFG
jgi:hypothetical protein